MPAVITSFTSLNIIHKPMKKSILKMAFFAFIAIASLSCKNDTKEVTTTDAKESLETSSTANRLAVDTSSSIIKWEGNKPVGGHTGTISIAQGEFIMNNGVIEGGNFLIDMKSISVTDLESGNGKESLESHLMGTVEGKEGDFFNVNKYPTATFEITGVETKEGKTMMSGNLTMLEKSNNITFPIVYNSNGTSMKVVSEEFEIDRTKWGIYYGSKSFFDSLGDNFIKDAMKITIELSAKK